jgi:hypothetical protein
MATKQISKQEAKDIMEMHLPKSKSKLMIGNLLRYIVLAIAVAVVAFAIFSPDDDLAVSGQDSDALSIGQIKKMVKEDGDYLVFDEQGRVVADLTVKDGAKRAIYFYEYYPYTEGITNGHDYTAVYYYYERDKNEMAYVEDTAMVICDDNFVGLRYHWYESYEDQLYWDYGIDDLNTIDYQADRIIYPMQQHISDDDVEYYSKVRVEKGNNHAVMTFYHGTNNKDQNVLTLVDISKKDPAAHSEERLQYYIEMDLTPDATIDEILEYIKANDIQYDTRDYKVYYKGINDVMSHRVYEWVENGNKRSTEIDYEVTQHDNGYYVAKLVE